MACVQPSCFCFCGPLPKPKPVVHPLRLPMMSTTRCITTLFQDADGGTRSGDGNWVEQSFSKRRASRNAPPLVWTPGSLAISMKMNGRVRGTGCVLKMPVCDVHKSLMSLSRICNAGHHVVFLKDGGKIEHEGTGQMTEFASRGGELCLPRTMTISLQVRL